MRKMVDVNYVMEVLGVSKSKAYVVLRKMNKELDELGYMTVAGKIPLAYFNKRFYSEGE